MKTTAPLSATFAAMLALALPVTPAQAQNSISFISGAGSDANNNCGSPATPCRNFAQALANTVSGGEITCVFTGQFDGNFTISQSVTIDCGGVVGFSLGQITINGAGIVVKLRNLTINGANFISPGVTFGINATNMAALFVENCQIL